MIAKLCAEALYRLRERVPPVYLFTEAANPYSRNITMLKALGASLAEGVSEAGSLVGNAGVPAEALCLAVTSGKPIVFSLECPEDAVKRIQNSQPAVICGTVQEFTALIETSKHSSIGLLTSADATIQVGAEFNTTACLIEPAYFVYSKGQSGKIASSRQLPGTEKVAPALIGGFAAAGASAFVASIAGLACLNLAMERAVSHLPTESLDAALAAELAWLTPEDLRGYSRIECATGIGHPRRALLDPPLP